MEGYQIHTAGFITENVRLEMVIGSLFLLFFSVFFHGRIAPAGTLAPMISMVPAMAVAQVHPLILGLLFSLLTLLVALPKRFEWLVSLNDRGTSAGLLLLFGVMGIRSSLASLNTWADGEAGFSWLLVLLTGGSVICFLLYRSGKSWLMIPAGLGFAFVLSFVSGQMPAFETGPGLPLISSGTWWLDRWGLPLSFQLSEWMRALPFAVLALLMLPLDAAAIQTMHRRNYGPYFNKVSLKMDETFIVTSLRNLAGVCLGGAQMAAVWRSFLIPLGVVRRPIPGSALLLGITCLLFAFAGYPIDLATHPPLLHLVLIFGVFVPMLLTGWKTIHGKFELLPMLICLLAGFWTHPLLGWIFGLSTGRIMRYLSGKRTR